MILEKIVLNNFRQFYGQQEILVSSDADKNVTIIHAENGVGKTTLLNALLWCFYEDTTARFENSEKIVSNQAITEGDHKAKVEVYFHHEGSGYLVSREIDEKYGDKKFIAYKIDDGNYTTLSNPVTFVRSVIPQEMSKYFFFDGEYAETFSSNNNRSAVKVALESMLGCNTAIQALDDLKSIKKRIEKDIAALTQGNQAAAFQTRIDTLEEQDRKDEADIITLETEIETNKDIRREIMDKLRGSEGAKEIQQKRDEQESLKLKAETKKIEIDAARTRWIRQSSTILFSQRAMEKQSEVEYEAKIKGLIPSNIAETFVKDILEKKNCICGRSFDHGSEEESSIKCLLQEAGSAEMNNRLMDIRKLIGNLEKSEETAWADFQKMSSQLNSLNEEIHHYESKIKEYSEQLRGSHITEIAEREQALEKCNAQIEELSGKKASLIKDRSERAEAIEENKRKRDQLMSRNERAQGLQKQIALVAATIVKLEDELTKYRDESRKALTAKINDILGKTARREYTAKIDENFNLDMFYGSTTTPVAKSSGENQLLSLAFIASLVDFAADRREQESHLLKPGTMAPLMLDSPFGQLDPTYKNSTADFLPKLSEQVILLLSKTQGDSEVIDILGKRIGAEYVLISENTSKRGDKPLDVIDLYGDKVECSVYEAEKDMTRVQKVI